MLLRRLLKITWLVFLSVLFVGCTTASPSATKTPTQLINQWHPASTQKIALLLPLQGNLGDAGSAIRDGFMAKYLQLYGKAQAQQPDVKIYDTADGSSINDTYAKAISDGATMVVGPLNKTDVTALQNQGGLPVPTLALNDSDNTSSVTNLYQFGLSPLDEARQVADKATAGGYHSALLIFPQGAWGQGIADALTKQWQQDGGTIVGSLALAPNDPNMSNAISGLLKANDSSRRQDMDVIFLIVQPNLARQIKPLLKYYYAGTIPVYSSSLIYNGLTNMTANGDLNDVAFCDMPFVLDQQGQWQQAREQFMSVWPAGLQQYIRLYALGMDAALLTQQLQNLNTSSSNGLSGATGILYRDNTNHIWRQLTWAEFQNGQATVMQQ